MLVLRRLPSLGNHASYRWRDGPHQTFWAARCRLHNEHSSQLWHVRQGLWHLWLSWRLDGPLLELHQRLRCYYRGRLPLHLFEIHIWWSIQKLRTLRWLGCLTRRWVCSDHRQRRWCRQQDARRSLDFCSVCWEWLLAVLQKWCADFCGWVPHWTWPRCCCCRHWLRDGDHYYWRLLD